MNILIVNAHSARNLGDEAIMRKTIYELQNCSQNVNIVISADDPQSWAEQKYPNVVVLPSINTWFVEIRNQKWKIILAKIPVSLLFLLVLILFPGSKQLLRFFDTENKVKLFDAYYNADLVLSCGGGNFYAHRKFRPFLFSGLFILYLAKLLRKNFVLLPQSYGPINGTIQQKLFQGVLNHSKLILAREPISLEYLKKLHISSPILLISDLAFGLSNQSEIYKIKQNSFEDRLNIGITVINRKAQQKDFSHQEIYIQTLVNLLRRIHVDYNVDIKILVQCSGPTVSHDDRIPSLQLADKLNNCGIPNKIINFFKSSEELLTKVCEMDLIITTRMHTGILALSNAIPILMIGYQSKAKGLMHWFELHKFYFDINAINLDEFWKAAKDLIENREKISCEINEKYHHVLNTQASWSRIVLEIITY